MALVDVTQPVVINPTLQIARLSNDFLRRVCFVSLGETKLLPKEYKEVYNFNYKEILNGYTETTDALKCFFAQASDKSCIVLELGKQEGDPLTDNYNNKINYLNTLSWFNIDDFYKWIYFNKWIDTYETESIVKEYYNSVSEFDEENYKDWLDLNRLTDNLSNCKKYLTQIDSKWMEGYYPYLAGSDNDFQSFLTDGVLKEWLDSLPKGKWDENAYNIWRDEQGTKQVDYIKKIEALDEFITNTSKPSYIYYIPRQMSIDSRLVSNIFQKYISLQSKNYFFLNVAQDTDIVNNKQIKNFKNLKSVALFYDNTILGGNLAASVAGLFASFKFDIGDTNPASPFNYKTLQGIKFNSLTQGTQKELIQESFNFMSILANNSVLLNGRYTDTYPIDYRYQWDLVSFEVENSLQTLILNGVNNPIYIIKYNQNGIDTLRSNIKATLDKMIQWGCVTDYAARMNAATGELENVGDITAIDFNSYVLSNPEDYQNEVYGGISFYLRIGRYIRQVILSITLG